MENPAILILPENAGSEKKMPTRHCKRSFAIQGGGLMGKPLRAQ
jgi:hypothetical protein